MCVISRPDHSQLCCWQKGWVTTGQWTHTPTNSLRMCVFVRHGSWFQCFWVSYLFSVHEKKWFCPGYTNPVLDSWGAGAHVSPGVSPLTLTCFNSSVQCLLLVPQTKRQTGLLCVYMWLIHAHAVPQYLFFMLLYYSIVRQWRLNQPTSLWNWGIIEPFMYCYFILASI